MEYYKNRPSAFESSISVVRDFLTLLQREQAALLARSVDEIEKITLEKQIAVSALEGSADSFSEILDTADPQVQQVLADLLIECRRYSEENAVLVNQGLKVNQASMDYLFKLTGVGTTSEYDQSGKVTFKAGNRRLGAA